jgi:hypothetical protein
MRTDYTGKARQKECKKEGKTVQNEGSDNTIIITTTTQTNTRTDAYALAFLQKGCEMGRRYLEAGRSYQ